MVYQHTLAAGFTCKGVGLHTGQPVSLTVNPGGPDSGIQFIRTDQPGRKKVRVGPDTVSGTAFATTIAGPGWFVSTVEHLMSALMGMGVDNAVVELDAEEVPIMDGSAAPFAYLIASVGLKQQSKPRRYLQVTRPTMIREAGKSVALFPHDGFRIDYEIEFEHPVIRRQNYSVDVTPESYVDELASARTFGFYSELNTMKANGFAAGGSLDNAVVLGRYSVLNKGGLRFPDEFVRHKVLDAVGDLFVTGMPILGRLVAVRAGHGLNNRLVRKLMAERGNWRVTEFAPKEGEKRYATATAAAAWAR